MKCLIELGTLCVSEGILGLFRLWLHTNTQLIPPKRWEAEKVD